MVCAGVWVATTAVRDTAQITALTTAAPAYCDVSGRLIRTLSVDHLKSLHIHANLGTETDQVSGDADLVSGVRIRAVVKGIEQPVGEFAGPIIRRPGGGRHGARGRHVRLL